MGIEPIGCLLAVLNSGLSVHQEGLITTYPEAVSAAGLGYLRCQAPRDEALRRGRAGHRPFDGRAPGWGNHLKGRAGDRANAVLAAAGYNFALPLRRLRRLLRALFRALFPPPICFNTAKITAQPFFTDDEL
jgi:hypothetical protein